MSDQVFTPIENRVMTLLKDRYIEEGWTFSGCVPAEDPALARCARDGDDALRAILHLIELGYIQKRDCMTLAFELSPAQRWELINSHDLADYWQFAGRGPGGDEYGEIVHVRDEVEKGNSNV